MLSATAGHHNLTYINKEHPEYIIWKINEDAAAAAVGILLGQI